MLIPWLEELEKSNSISKEAAQAIYKDCSDLIESSLVKEGQSSGHGLTSRERKKLSQDHPELLTQYVTAMDENNKAEQAKFYQSKMEEDKATAARLNTQKAIAEFVPKSISTITGPMGTHAEKMTRPYRIARSAHTTGNFLNRSFADEDIPKALARFEEILDIAPSLAQDPLTMQSMVSSSIHTGLTTDDKHYLRQMQAAEGNSMWDTGRMKKTLLKGRDMKLKSSLQRALRKSAMIRADNLATIFEVIQEGIGGNEKVAGSLDTSNARKAAETTTAGFKYVKEGLKPSLGNVGSQALKTIAWMSGASLVAGGLTGIGNTLVAFKRKKDLEKQLASSYEQAMGGKDDASRTLRENREKAKASFESLVHFAPDVASQKGAAKAFMYKMIAVGGPEVGMTTGDIKDLSSIQQNISNSKGPGAFASGFAAAGKLTGLGDITSKAIGETTKPFAQQSSEMASSYLEAGGPGFISSVPS